MRRKTRSSTSRPRIKHGTRSSLEDQLVLQLEGAKVRYEYEARKLVYTLERHYTPDFFLDNGIIIEAKGYWETEDRQKILLIKKQHPELDLRMVFQDASKPCRKGRPTTYGQFCDKHGIPWADGGVIPREWLNADKP